MSKDKSWFVYILKCNDGTYYTGSTKDMERRLKEHHEGLGAIYTKNRLPVEVLYYEGYDRIDQAFYREKQMMKQARAQHFCHL